MALRRVRRTHHECYLELISAQVHERFSRGAFGDLHLDTGIDAPVSTDQVGEEAVRNQAMDTYAQTAAFSQGRHARGFYSMVEVVDAGRHPLDKEASGLGEPDASRVTLEQDNTKLFQRLDPCADARLADAESVGSAVEAEVFGDGKRLDGRCKRNARTECARYSPLTRWASPHPITPLRSILRMTSYP